MSKREQARLVHEVRDALIRRAFLPSRLVPLDGPHTVRAPGFNVQKHGDGKSVRVSYEAGDAPPAGAGRGAAEAFGRLLLRGLAKYHEALEQEGYACLGIDSRDPLTPYSIWRRKT